MPFYYASPYTQLSLGTSATDQGRYTSGSVTAFAFTGLFGACNNTTAGGVLFRLINYATPSTSGTAATAGLAGFPAPRIFGRGPTANTSVHTVPTPGSGNTAMMISVGAPATGGMGGWIATDPDNWISMQAGGSTSASTNMEFYTLASNASTNADATIEFAELN